MLPVFSLSWSHYIINFPKIRNTQITNTITNKPVFHKNHNQRTNYQQVCLHHCYYQCGEKLVRFCTSPLILSIISPNLNFCKDSSICFRQRSFKSFHIQFVSFQSIRLLTYVVISLPNPPTNVTARCPNSNRIRCFLVLSPTILSITSLIFCGAINYSPVIMSMRILDAIIHRFYPRKHFLIKFPYLPIFSFIMSLLS